MAVSVSANIAGKSVEIWKGHIATLEHDVIEGFLESCGEINIKEAK